MNNYTKCFITFCATLAIVCTPSLAYADEWGSQGVGFNSGNVNDGSPRPSKPLSSAEITEKQRFEVQRQNIKKYSSEENYTPSGSANDETINHGKTNKDIGKDGASNKSNKGVEHSSGLPIPRVGLDTRYGAGTRAFGCYDSSLGSYSCKVSNINGAHSNQYVACTLPYWNIGSVDTGLDKSLTSHCPVRRSGGGLAGTDVEEPIGGAFVQVNATKGTSVGPSIPGTKLAMGKIVCSLPGAFGHERKINKSFTTSETNKDRAISRGARQCKNYIFNAYGGIQGLASTFGDWVHNWWRTEVNSTNWVHNAASYPAYYTVSESDKRSASQIDKFDKCPAGRFPMAQARNGYAQLNQKTPTKDLYGGSIKNGKLAGQGGFANGCLYKHRRTKIRMTTFLSADLLCVKDVHYGEGKTHAGQLWTDGKDTKYLTEYGKNYSSFASCVNTFHEKYPKDGDAPLLPNKSPQTLLGRYSNFIEWTLDDPDIELEGCVPSLDNDCKGVAIKILGHNEQKKRMNFMVRQACSFSPSKTGETMSKAWFGVGNITDDLTNPLYDTFNGRVLTYTLADCGKNDVPTGERYYCEAGNGESTPISIKTEVKAGRENVEPAPLSMLTLEKRPELEKSQLYQNLYSTPSIANQPVEGQGADEKEQMRNAYYNGIVIVRNNISKAYTYELPKIVSDIGNYMRQPAQNVRVTNSLLLVHKDGTPFIDTPVAKSKWRWTNGTVSSLSTASDQNPFLPPEWENGVQVRTNKYYGQRDNIPVHKFADSLDLRIYSWSPDNSTKTEVTQMTPAKMAKIGDTIFSRWNDYHIYRLGSRNRTVSFASPWLSTEKQPHHVNYAVEMTGDFPVMMMKVHSLNPNGYKPEVFYNYETIKSGKMMCIGPDTIVRAYRTNG